MVFTMGTVAFAGVEPNNSMEKATSLGNDNYIRTYGVVSSYDVEDWWYFYVKDSSPFNLALVWGAENTFSADLYLYDETGKLLVKAPSITYDYRFIEDYYLRTGKKYYIRVKYNSGCLTHTPYGLVIKQNPM
jgi:hypothetical protein